MYRTDFWTLWEKARVGCFKRTAFKHVYYLGWNRSPAQVGCMRQVLRPGALGRPRGIRWRGRWEGGSGWVIHVYPWLIHVNVWKNPLQYCKVISLQLIKKRKKKSWAWDVPGGLVIENLPSNAGDVGSVLGWETKIPHALEQLNLHATTREKPTRCNWDLMQPKNKKLICFEKKKKKSWGWYSSDFFCKDLFLSVFPVWEFGIWRLPAAKLFS